MAGRNLRIGVGPRAHGSLLLLLLIVGLADGRPTRAQDDSGIVELLDRIEAEGPVGAADRFRALLQPGATGAPLAAFIDQWFPASTTRVALQERDRVLLADGTERLLVEALIERGDEAELATWRLDVVRGADGVSRRIRDAGTVDTVTGLFRLTLDPKRQFQARDLIIRSEDFELRLPDGAVFVAEANGDATAIVLLGRGEMVFKPAPEAERRQLILFAGSETLSSRFDAAFVRVSPADAAPLLPADRVKPVAVDADLFKDAERVFADEFVKSFVIDLPGLSDNPWSLLPPSGDLLAEVRTRRHDTLTYLHSADDAEDIALFDRRRRRNIASYASKARLASRGPFYDEDDRADYNVLNYDLSVAFTPARLWFDGEAHLRIRVRAAVVNSIAIRLAETLVARSVTSDLHGRLLHFRVRNQNRVIVNLPGGAERGDEFTVTVRYGGRLEPQVLDRENLTLQEPLPPEAFQPPALIRPAPAWIYSTRSDWYPQAPISDFATNTIRFDLPEPYGVACSGSPSSGSPTPLADATGRAQRRFVYTATSPIRYLACTVSRFAGREHRALSANPDRSTKAASVDAAGLLYLMDATNDRGRARETLSRADRILGFYASMIGEVPYRDMTLATVEALTPGGHAPAHLAVMYQPLSSTPITWANDPAHFDGFDDFFLAHELAHQWWGQAVGWQNYHEQWLSEGFAQYFAALYAEYDRGPRTFRNILQQLSRSTRSESHQGPVYLGYRIGHLESNSRAFRAIVYNKGAMVLHMLRSLLGDEKFFEGVRQFYRVNRFTKAGTADFRQAMEQASGRSLVTFFEQWIFGQNLPRAEVSWAAAGSHVRLLIRQQGEAFTFPLPVTLIYQNGTRSQMSVPIYDARAEFDLPLAGPLRTVAFNDGNTIPVRIDD